MRICDLFSMFQSVKSSECNESLRLIDHVDTQLLQAIRLSFQIVDIHECEIEDSVVGIYTSIKSQQKCSQCV